MRSNIEFCRDILNTEAFQGPGVTTDYLDGKDFKQNPDENALGIVAIIATAAEKFGLNKSKHTSSNILDRHSGNEQDPFRTLAKRFP